MSGNKKVITLAQVRKAENDPKLHDAAQRRADTVTKRLKAQQPKMNVLAKAAQDPLTLPGNRVRLLWQMADLFVDTTKNVSPCARGCNHCCYQPVQIGKMEADYIGQAIGVAPAAAPYHLERTDAYIGAPCVFLKQGACSIYAHRPFVCRTHVSMAPDDILCRIFPGEAIRVPYYNVMSLYKILAEALDEDPVYRAADVREFFPEGRRHG